jgi:hypothetical protein
MTSFTCFESCFGCHGSRTKKDEKKFISVLSQPRPLPLPPRQLSGDVTTADTSVAIPSTTSSSEDDQRKKHDQSSWTAIEKLRKKVYGENSSALVDIICRVLCENTPFTSTYFIRRETITKSQQEHAEAVARECANHVREFPFWKWERQAGYPDDEQADRMRKALTELGRLCENPKLSVSNADAICETAKVIMTHYLETIFPLPLSPSAAGVLAEMRSASMQLQMVMTLNAVRVVQKFRGVRNYGRIVSFSKGSTCRKI